MVAAPTRPSIAATRPRRPRAAFCEPHPAVDPVQAAKHAGLRYVTDVSPGITRKRAGTSFAYVRPDGSRVAGEDVLRIKALAIPPAWTDVWICPREDGHLQATGRDARGRKQYRYHERWREVRDDAKYGRMVQFGELLPEMRRLVDADLALPHLPRRKVLATVVRLLESTLIRVGNEEYARANESYGLTTMRDGHVDISGSTLKFCFRGKSGKEHSVGIRDRRLAAIVKRCQDLPGEDLFQYVDEGGEVQCIGSGDVNDYLRELSGSDVTAKDFRTWAGTVLAAVTLDGLGPCESETQAKRNIVGAVRVVSERLGNTPAVCRKCYVHPAIFESYVDGTLAVAFEGTHTVAGLSDDEACTLELLRTRLAQAA